MAVSPALIREVFIISGNGGICRTSMTDSFGGSPARQVLGASDIISIFERL